MNPTPSTNPAIAVIAPAKNTPRHDRFLATTSPFTQAPARACGQPHIDLRHISTQKGRGSAYDFHGSTSTAAQVPAQGRQSGAR